MSDRMHHTELAAVRREHKERAAKPKRVDAGEEALRALHASIPNFKTLMESLLWIDYWRKAARKQVELLIVERNDFRNKYRALAAKRKSDEAARGLIPPPTIPPGDAP